jgi:hypothetical protein
MQASDKAIMLCACKPKLQKIANQIHKRQCAQGFALYMVKSVIKRRPNRQGPELTLLSYKCLSGVVRTGTPGTFRRRANNLLFL